MNANPGLHAKPWTGRAKLAEPKLLSWHSLPVPNQEQTPLIGCLPLVDKRISRRVVPGADYSDETFGGAIEIGKRWDIGKLFLEPQGQLEGAWADSESYRASNGLRVSASSQGSLRGRLGVSAGLHLESGHMAFEPFVGGFVINEFLGGDGITPTRPTSSRS